MSSTRTSTDFREPRAARIRARVRRVRASLTRRNVKEWIYGFLPILKWLPQYDWKHSFFGDLSGGLTMAVFCVPQGIALAGITGVDPVYGLYTAIFPSFLYIFFGTSKHNALGGFAVLSLMTHSAIEKVVQSTAVPYNTTEYINRTLTPNFENGNETEFAGNETEAILNSTFYDDSSFYNGTSFIEEVTRIQWTSGLRPTEKIVVATTVLFLAGIIQILMGLLRLHYFFRCYFSEQVMSGFIVGGCVHVIFSQLGDALGIQLPKRNGPGYLYYRLLDLIELFPTLKLPTAIISALSAIFLLIGKEFLTPWLSEVFFYPVPYELILVIIGITATNFAELARRHKINVVGNIPTNFPPPSPPRLDLVPSILHHSFGIALAATAIHLTVAKVVEKRYKYKIDYGQELYALGFTSLLSSLFPVFPFTSGFARSVIGAAVGSSTQLTCFFSSLALLSVILKIGPALEYLPQCILATMIIMSQKLIFAKFYELKELWPVFKYDFTIWIASMLFTICCDIAEGILLSVGFAILTTVIRSQRPRWHYLIANADGAFRETKRKELEVVSGDPCVIRMNAPLIFTSVDRFEVAVWEGVKKWERAKTMQPVRSSQNEDRHNLDSLIDTAIRGRKSTLTSSRSSRCSLVIDCSGFPYVDYLGMVTLKSVFADLTTAGVQTCFAAPHRYLQEMFENTDFYSEVGEDRVKDTVQEAVLYLTTFHPTGAKSQETTPPPPKKYSTETIDLREKNY
ncbi:unnamed protein product, partial [Mesorhabditis belari]|uniref:STAS domain-containing protein n=1 Tax=Mesorhabditis belari TaxID=2138241 RepID=A0AAF3J7N3_9BILA